MEIVYGNEENFNEMINNEYVLVDFFATWCGPCKMLGPVLENVKDLIQVVKIDIDENMNLAKDYGVMSVPTLILFKQGNKIDQQSGFLPEISLKEWITDNK